MSCPPYDLWELCEFSAHLYVTDLSAVIYYYILKPLLHSSSIVQLYDQCIPSNNIQLPLIASTISSHATTFT